MSDQIFDLTKYAKKAREAIAEGIVMLKNDNQTLPLSSDNKLAVFGRTQLNYYKSGTGSGGLVNTRYVMGIYEALGESFELNPKLRQAYQEWEKDHPYQAGKGWATEPWFQEEMVLTEELINSVKKESDTAIIILGRTAGEDQDNSTDPGSYLLTDLEHDMLKGVCKAFDRTIVLLNVGNIIDMKWVEEYNPSAVMYVWQGGQEGGNGVLDVLRGTVSPSGKLSDTIAYDLTDYPSSKYYGDAVRNHYVEDIYVGYRYFETFAKEKVMYPFGFGLSYTEFTKEMIQFDEKLDQIAIIVRVTNTGKYPGKEVVQVYCEAPQGKLGKPARVLCGFAKTPILEPRESVEVCISFSKYMFASYDDSGITGFKSSYVLEEGRYCFYLGDDVRRAKEIAYIVMDHFIVLETLHEAMAPVTPFQRMRPRATENGYEVVMEEVPLGTVDPKDRRIQNMPKEIPYAGSQGYQLKDVAEGNITMDAFISQLSKEDLCCIVRGEGMSSPKVTPGTAGAFGGVTPSLKEYGIPIGCCADGPSGIRMDCGTIAFSMPNGTLLACTFNETLLEELYEFEGLELRKNRIDTLLGPGMNLHRHPLNGRNFEYFSEDSLLTGKMAAAQLRGLHRYGVTGTIKHFACNNQEYMRNDVEAVVSERALRELYLKGFEIAVKEGEAFTIMSTYGPVNGFWTASHYDLLTTILRKEWGFEGIVMTDWWAKGNDAGEDGSTENMAAMIRSQNDLYMVTANAEENANNDNSEISLTNGSVSRAEYQQCARNICNVLMKLPAYERFYQIESDLEKQLDEYRTEEEDSLYQMEVISVDQQKNLDVQLIDPSKGKTSILKIAVKDRGTYGMTLRMRSVSESPLAQLSVSVFMDNNLVRTITLKGDDTQWLTEVLDLGYVWNRNFYLKFFFAQGGVEIETCQLSMIHE